MLKVTHLDFFYGKVQVLKDISLEVQQGVVTLIGPNGAGKSTLLRLVSGLLKPARGRIEFDGQELSSLKAHEVVRLGVVHVPERRRIFPQLTVMENLELGAYVR